MIESYPWHNGLLADLESRLQADTVPAAIGLSCAEGWGERSLLTRVAYLLLGIGPDKDPEELAHPDFRWVAPEGSVIKIDQVRALNAFAVQTPQIAGRKVAAVLDAHLLNTNAANTLLKTLEEPPANTHILLCTPYWSRLLPTIRSRCQRLQVPISAQQAEQWLEQQGLAFSPEQFAQLGYAPVAMLDQSEVMNLQGLVDQVSRADHFSALVEEVLGIGPQQVLAGWYRLLIQYQQNQPNRALLAFADEVNETRRMIETSNSTNVRLALERLFHLWQQVSAHMARQRRAV